MMWTLLAQVLLCLCLPAGHISYNSMPLPERVTSLQRSTLPRQRIWKLIHFRCDLDPCEGSSSDVVGMIQPGERLGV